MVRRHLRSQWQMADGKSSATVCASPDLARLFASNSLLQRPSYFGFPATYRIYLNSLNKSRPKLQYPLYEPVKV